VGHQATAFPGVSTIVDNLTMNDNACRHSVSAFFVVSVSSRTFAALALAIKVEQLGIDAE
jgi:hypothetical protein